MRRAIVHEVIDWQVNDLIEQAIRVLAGGKFTSGADVRRAPVVISPSAEIAEKKAVLEQFLFDNVYRHPGVLAKRRPAQHALREMFEAFVSQPNLLPPKFQRLAQEDGVPRATSDYLAGMTDRFAVEEHTRLFRKNRPMVAPPRG
jgi:dGTPase